MRPSSSKDVPHLCLDGETEKESIASLNHQLVSSKDDHLDGNSAQIDCHRKLVFFCDEACHFSCPTLFVSIFISTPSENVDGDEFPEMEAEKNPEGDSGVENEEDKERERKAKEEQEKEENLKTLFKGCKFFLGREVNRWVLVDGGAFVFLSSFF